MGKDGLAYSSARDVTEREAELQRRSHKAAEEQVLSAVMAGALSARSEPAIVETAIKAMAEELPWVSALRGVALDLFPADAADASMHRAHATGAPPAPNAVLACMLSARAQADASDSAGGGATAVIIAGPEPDDACVPIQEGDRLIGVLTLSGIADAMSLGLETDFLSRLAAALALALAHQRKTREAERERLTALAALAEVSSYRAALERHMIVLETDRDGRITKVNAHFERLTGYSAGEVIDRNPRLLNSGLHTPDHFATMWQTILAGEPWHGEHCNRAKDGQLYWVQVTIIPVPGDDGGIARFVALQVDITERKRLAETLTVTNRRLERLAAVSGVGGWERDLETGVVEWDEGLRRIYEVSPDLVPGNALRLSHFPPEVASMLAAAAERCAADGTPLDFEVPAVTYSGKPIWVRVAAVAVWEDGRITRLSGAVQDITVRKLREAETERLRARFEAIFENTGSLIFMKNREGRFIGANGRFLAAVQRPDVTGLTDFDLTPHAVAEKLDAVDRRVFETGQPMLVEESVIRPSGAHQFFVSSKFLIDDPLLGDKIMVGIATDVTAMKKRDAENARLRQRFDAFMENASALIFLKRRDGSFITGNRRLLDFLGLQDEAELRGRLSADFSPPEIVEALQSVDRRVFETGLPSFVEEMVIRDGIARYFLTSKFLIPDAEEGDLVLCAIATEITEQKRLQASLEAATREAEAASLAKSQFLATMSHEIRTPMNGVIGMAELLARAVTDPEHRRMVGVIRESGDVLLNVINDILDFSKIEVGRVELESVPFSLREIGRKVESVHALKAAEKGLTFEMLFGVGIEALRLGDPHRLQQVLHNLVGNAVKFTEKGEVSVALRATAPDTVVITVRDTGLGMTAEQQGRIFEEFAQADSSTTRRFGGTGLGLPIAKGLVEAMGGTIAVVSEASRGTSFTVTLPLPLAPAASASTRPADAAEVLPEGLVVLAADDNEVNRMVLSAYLGSLGVRVVMVDGGAAAVALRDSEPFDALLLDIAMPGMDGIEALTAIRARETALGLPRIPAVAVTANAMSHQIEEYLAAGFDAHVAKPIRRERLVEALQALGAARDIRRGQPG
jgi:PAS domain S-box-containing protein